RKGMSWDKLLANMRLLQKECPHIQFEIAPTISILNLNTFGKIHQFFVENGLIKIDSIYLNLLDRPRNYNIQILPVREKEMGKSELYRNIEWLQSNDAEQKTIDEYRSIIEYLEMESNPDEFVLFHDYNTQLDQIREENYSDFHE
ncbi:MAG: hypothetical protein AAFQ94_24260, partial [Bacteroidota bacterium]